MGGHSAPVSSGPVQREETVPYRSSSSIILRIEASIAYNPWGILPLIECVRSGPGMVGTGIGATAHANTASDVTECDFYHSLVFNSTCRAHPSRKEAVRTPGSVWGSKQYESQWLAPAMGPKSYSPAFDIQSFTLVCRGSVGRHSLKPHCCW